MCGTCGPSRTSRYSPSRSGGRSAESVRSSSASRNVGHYHEHEWFARDVPGRVDGERRHVHGVPWFYDMNRAEVISAYDLASPLRHVHDLRMRSCVPFTPGDDPLGVRFLEDWQRADGPGLWTHLTHPNQSAKAIEAPGEGRFGVLSPALCEERFLLACSSQSAAMNAYGTGLVRLTFAASNATDQTPGWSRNGAPNGFSQSHAMATSRFTGNANGANQLRLTSDPKNDAAPNW